MSTEDMIKNMESVGAAAVADAEVQWERGVQDIEGHQDIERYVELSTGRRIPYRKNGKGKLRQWCGDFVAACYSGLTGEPGMAPCIKEHLMQSTYRLWLYGQYRLDWSAARGVGLWRSNMMSKPVNGELLDIQEWHKQYECERLFCMNPSRCLSFTPKPGDIATVNRAKRGPWGKHIVLVVGYDEENKCLQTIEGNAWGLPPDPEIRRWEGVVRQVRPLSSVALILRPSVLDFTHGLEVLR